MSIVATGTFDELRAAGLDENSAKRIVNWKGRKDAKTLNDFRGVLRRKQITEVGNKLNSLTSAQEKDLDEPATNKNSPKNIYGRPAPSREPTSTPTPNRTRPDPPPWIYESTPKPTPTGTPKGGSPIRKSTKKPTPI